MTKDTRMDDTLEIERKINSRERTVILYKLGIPYDWMKNARNIIIRINNDSEALGRKIGSGSGVIGKEIGKELSGDVYKTGYSIGEYLNTLIVKVDVKRGYQTQFKNDSKA